MGGIIQENLSLRWKNDRKSLSRAYDNIPDEIKNIRMIQLKKELNRHIISLYKQENNFKC